MMSLQQLEQLHNMGLSLIPISNKVVFNTKKQIYEPNKKPIIDSWTEFQVGRAGLQQLKFWFETLPNCNWAIVTGKVSGVTVLDQDSVCNVNIPPTLRAKSPKPNALHHYFKYCDKLLTKSRVLEKEPLDIRNDGGYIIIPPSKYEYNGQVWEYKWERNFDINALSDFPIELFEAQITTEKSRTNWSEFTEKKNVSGTRNDATCKYGGKLLQQFDQHEWDTLGWNAFKNYDLTQNVPPIQEEWGIDDLRNKWDGLKKSELQKAKHSNTNESSIIKPLQLKSFLAQEVRRAKCVVNDLIPEGITVLSGDPESYKTWLLMHLGRSLVTGVKFLNHFDVNMGGIYLLDKENTLSTVRGRLLTLNMPDTAPFFYDTNKDFMADDNSIARIGDFCVKHNIKVLTLDSLISMLPGSENDSQVIRTLFNSLRKHLVDRGVSVIVVHHNKKIWDDTKNISELNRLAGSRDIQAAADFHLSVHKVDSKTLSLVEAKNRCFNRESRTYKVNVISRNNGLEFEVSN